MSDKPDNSIVGIVGSIIAIVLMPVVTILGIKYYDTWQVNEFLFRENAYLQESQQYYFNGANNRGYLDICRDSTGKVKVLFKDECVNDNQPQ